MYDQQDFSENFHQLRGQLLVLALIALPFLAGIVVSFILRIEWLTIALSLVLGAACIFLYNLRVSPITAYRRYLRDVTSGLKRETQGTLVSIDSDESLKEGVRFHTLLVNVDPKMDPEGERLFYFDVCKPCPAVNAGDTVHVVSHGNYVLKLTQV